MFFSIALQTLLSIYYAMNEQLHFIKANRGHKSQSSQFHTCIDKLDADV